MLAIMVTGRADFYMRNTWFYQLLCKLSVKEIRDTYIWFICPAVVLSPNINQNEHVIETKHQRKATKMVCR